MILLTSAMASQWPFFGYMSTECKRCLLKLGLAGLTLMVALFWVVCYGDETRAKALLDGGARIGSAILAAALQRDEASMTSLLLDRQPDLTILDVMSGICVITPIGSRKLRDEEPVLATIGKSADYLRFIRDNLDSFNPWPFSLYLIERGFEVDNSTVICLPGMLKSHKTLK